MVKKNLELYIKNIIKSGQVPFRIGPQIPLNYLGIITKFKPRYNNDKSNRKSVDQNSLIVISAYNVDTFFQLRKILTNWYINKALYNVTPPSLLKILKI